MSEVRTVWKKAYSLLLKSVRLPFIHSDDENPYSFGYRAFDEGRDAEWIRNSQPIQLNLQIKEINLYDFVTGKLLLPKDCIIEMMLEFTSRSRNAPNIVSRRDENAIYFKRRSDTSIDFYDPYGITMTENEKKRNDPPPYSLTIMNIKVNPNDTTTTFVDNHGVQQPNTTRRNVYFAIYIWGGNGEIETIRNNGPHGGLMMIQSKIGDSIEYEEKNEDQASKKQKIDEEKIIEIKPVTPPRDDNWGDKGVEELITLDPPFEDDSRSNLDHSRIEYEDQTFRNQTPHNEVDVNPIPVEHHEHDKPVAIVEIPDVATSEQGFVEPIGTKQKRGRKPKKTTGWDE